ncbi:MAG: hypothetical protein JWO79_4419 [Actinomycetia bacterium]|nr:hypothetical protein [Actinomycetes bacterium]MDQ1654757.1 branched-chain amino acid transport system substrate-binding protein [Cryptosporangiaceae bacterium]
MRSGLRALTAVCALSLVAAAGCGRPGDALAEQVTIGATLELTGPAAIVGLAHRNALQLAADQLNAAGGVRGQRINLRIRDNRSLPDVAAADVKALAAGDVAAIIGGGTTETSVAAAVEAEQARVPLIALGPSPEITAPAEQRRYTFKTEPNPDAVVGTLVDEFGVQNIRSIGIFASTGTYGDAGLAALQAGAAQRNIRVAGIERFGEDDRDLDAAAGRLRAIRPDAVVVWSPLPGAGVAARSLRDSGYQPGGGKVYFDPGVGAEQFLRDAGAAAEGSLVVNPAILAVIQTAATTPSALAQKEFVTKYTQRYGTFSGYASYSADALHLVATAIHNAGTADREAIRAALERVNYEGLSGSYDFSETSHGGAAGDGLAVLQVRDQGWVMAP